MPYVPMSVRFCPHTWVLASTDQPSETESPFLWGICYSDDGGVEHCCYPGMGTTFHTGCLIFTLTALELGKLLL